MTKGKSYTGIDIAKFIMAILVLMLHTNPFMDISKSAEWFSRNCFTVIAVPFFFTATGYFALRDDLVAKKSIKRLCALYLIWSAIYLPFAIIKLDGKSNKLLTYIYKFFVVGSYDTIWYLLASVIGVAIVLGLSKLIGKKGAFAVMLALHIFAILGTAYLGMFKGTFIDSLYGAYYKIFETFKNGVFFAGVYVALGALIFETGQTENPQKHNGRLYLIISIVLFFGLCAESAGVKYLGFDTHGVDMKFMLIPFTYFFFNFLLQAQCNISDNAAVLLRKMSILIFLSQRLFLTGYEMLGVKVNSFVWFVIITFSTMAFSYAVILLSKKIKILKAVY